jgi:hypothetical protein
LTKELFLNASNAKNISAQHALKTGQHPKHSLKCTGESSCAPIATLRNTANPRIRNNSKKRKNSARFKPDAVLVV